jgi:ubiquinone/menaquinone biosynthesis C-methylase UbiE
MTPEMLKLAAENKKKVGVENVEFRRGYLEDLPVHDGTVDVIVSNCVINLSADKDAVFREAYRVLKPNGRVVFSDIVARSELPRGLRKNMEAWAECVAGAIPAQEYAEKMSGAGFRDIHIAGEATPDDLVYSAKFSALK